MRTALLFIFVFGTLGLAAIVATGLLVNVNP